MGNGVGRLIDDRAIQAGAEQVGHGLHRRDADLVTVAGVCGDLEDPLEDAQHVLAMGREVERVRPQTEHAVLLRSALEAELRLADASAGRDVAPHADRAQQQRRARDAPKAGQVLDRLRYRWRDAERLVGQMGGPADRLRRPRMPRGIEATEDAEARLLERGVVPLAVAREHEALEGDPAIGGHPDALGEIRAGRLDGHRRVAELRVRERVTGDLLRVGGVNDRVDHIRAVPQRIAPDVATWIVREPVTLRSRLAWVDHLAVGATAGVAMTLRQEHVSDHRPGR